METNCVKGRAKEENLGNLSVRVLNDEGRSLKDVTVKIKGPDTRTGGTDKDGQMTFASVKLGKYEVIMSKSKFATETRQAHVAKPGMTLLEIKLYKFKRVPKQLLEKQSGAWVYPPGPPGTVPLIYDYRKIVVEGYIDVPVDAVPTGEHWDEIDGGEWGPLGLSWTVIRKTIDYGAKSSSYETNQKLKQLAGKVRWILEFYASIKSGGLPSPPKHTIIYLGWDKYPKSDPHDMKKYQMPK
jgi:hypothetical protein